LSAYKFTVLSGSQDCELMNLKIARLGASSSLKSKLTYADNESIKIVLHDIQELSQMSLKIAETQSLSLRVLRSNASRKPRLNLQVGLELSILIL